MSTGCFPRYANDCRHCVWLGRESGEWDLYFCARPGKGPAVVAVTSAEGAEPRTVRWELSDDRPDDVRFHSALEEAKRQGYLDVR